MATEAPINSATNKIDVSGYLETYLLPPIAQEASESNTDAQLNSILSAVIERFQKIGKQCTLFDIGCGNGTLLNRLLESTPFLENDNWIYVAIDIDSYLDKIHFLSRKYRINRRVELINLTDFYDKWPAFKGAKIIFTRNLFHELNIKKTATLINYISNNIEEDDVFICQDLMTFPSGERHNACWFPTNFADCIRAHGFSQITALPYNTRSGARWFNLIAEKRGKDRALFTPEQSEVIIREQREKQWRVWSRLDEPEQKDEPRQPSLLKAIDLDLQLAALTRQLLDSGASVDLSATQEHRLRGRELARAIENFLAAGQLIKAAVTERTRLRERGEQLNMLEQFLRGAEKLAVIRGGSGTGKTTLAEHLLVARSYGKTPVIINGKRATDIWSFVEQLFSQVGLRLAADRLSILKDLNWNAIEVPLRQFINQLSRRIIIFIDNFDALIDSNGTIDDPNVGNALSIILGAQSAKVILALRGQIVPAQLQKAANTNVLCLVQLGRYATDQTVINILDDRFDRASAGVSQYSDRLLRAIDRHPLAAMLAAEILHKHGMTVLIDERFYSELEQKLRQDLWGRLVDEASFPAVDAAADLRVPVPRKMLTSLSSQESVIRGIDSSALYLLKDHRWEELVTSLAVFRRRRIDGDDRKESRIENESRNLEIADRYISIYQQDDDPKWIRESYFHRMLSSTNKDRTILSSYYNSDLISSAYYCFSKLRDYKAALELYDAALKAGTLSEEAKMHRASCLVRLNHRPVGDQIYSRLISEYPQNYGLKTSYVDALLYLRDFRAALQSLNDLKLEPDKNFWIAGQWGRAWLGLDEYSQAERMFRKQIAMEKLPDPQIFVNLSRALQYQGATSEALDILTAGRDLHRDDIGIAIALGANLERLRRDSDALDVLQPIFETRPDRSAAALPIIKIYGRTGRAPLARRVLTRLQQFVGHDPDKIAVTAEAEVLKAEGRPEAAVRLLQQQPGSDIHLIGMILECSYHHAIGEGDRVKRVQIAIGALNYVRPKNLEKNIPLLVNLARLAAIAGEEKFYNETIAKIQASRVENFEVSSLQQLWSANNR